MGPNRKTSDKPRYDEGSDVINVRPATPADAAEIASLCAELGYPRSKEESERRLELIADASDLLLVAAAESTGQLIGFIQAKRVCIIEVGVRVEILGLVVAEKFLRGGIGRHLIAEVERWARARSVEAVVVRSNTERVESHVFYPALGYRPIKTQAVYEKRLP